MINGTWGTDGFTIFIDPSHGIQEHSLVHVAEVEDGDYARRIVACVNACKGIPTGQLERLPDELIKRVLYDAMELAMTMEGRT